MTATVPGALLAQGSGNGSVSSTLTFSLQNLWSYPTGIYTQTTDFTAASP
jgi:hypothetical protein